ncbi:hypothetical protein BSL78_17263 [Apostichopus japonicus]|uniref:Uncharacterized protein n=1 Tax=Stichopus japonicus TaxID=307972 RepID=A0A2G8KCX3_STIJA|nr:hypothetical protein BSL78_17263 [Apostichopus japonicus]
MTKSVQFIYIRNIVVYLQRAKSVAVRDKTVAKMEAAAHQGAAKDVPAPTRNVRIVVLIVNAVQDVANAVQAVSSSVMD